MNRSCRLTLGPLLLALAGCASDAPSDPPPPEPDVPQRAAPREPLRFPRRIEAPRPPTAERVGRFRLDRRISGPVKGLPAGEVFGVARVDPEALLAATAQGLFRGYGGSWSAVPGLEGTQVTHLAYDPRSKTSVALSESGVFRIAAGRATRVADLPGRVVSLSASPRVLMATSTGLFRLKNTTLSPVRPPSLSEGATILQIAQGRSGQLAVGASDGLYTVRGKRWESLTPIDETHRWSLRDVSAVCYDAKDRLWFASPVGVGRLDLDWRLWAARDGIPYTGFTCLAPGREGTVWLGTDRGAVKHDGETWSYRQGRRWLPGDRVHAVSADAHTGQALFATSGGLGAIAETSQVTLARKAARYQSDVERRHLRTPLGYVAEVRLKVPGDVSAWTQRDTDNDGLWTSLYGAAQCFLYAATKDPGAKLRAKRAFEAVRFLSQVTQGGTPNAKPGFPARTILPTSGPNPNETYTRERDAQKQADDPLWKVMHPRWPTSADGKWYWKADTSSDELDGHMFFYAQYHDLVADEAERARVAEVVTAIVDHLLDNDYRLIDWDGEPTRWANYAPDSLNDDPAWADERGLNSLSMLAYLKVAQRVSGRERYADAAQLLIERHGYDRNVLGAKVHKGPGTGNQSDDQLMVLAFYMLLSYEENQRLRATYSEGFRRAWELLRPERNPFFNFAYAGVCERDANDREWIAESVETLKRYPLRPIRWAHDNRARADVVPLEGPDPITGDTRPRGRLRDGRAIRIDERWSGRWSDNPWALTNDGDGTTLAPGTPYLLAYGMGLYHGYLAE